MKPLNFALHACVLAGLAMSSTAWAAETIRARLAGAHEVPPISTPAEGEFRGKISNDGASINYTLTYTGIETDVAAAHIHFCQEDVNGGVSVFLCGGDKPACPPAPATVSGTISAADVIGPTAQGIAPGELDELINAIRDRLSYINVHSAAFPGGEIRGQVK